MEVLVDRGTYCVLKFTATKGRHGVLIYAPAQPMPFTQGALCGILRTSKKT